MKKLAKEKLTKEKDIYFYNERFHIFGKASDIYRNEEGKLFYRILHQDSERVFFGVKDTKFLKLVELVVED